MQYNFVKALSAAALAAVFAAGPSEPASAQAEATKPIRLISSQATGGGIDALLRAIAIKFQASTGQPMVVEARPGASGILAGTGCAKSTPDGTNICLLMTQQLILSSLLYNKQNFDAEKDLVPITMLVHAPSALAVHQSVPVKTFPELLAYSKANPGKLNYVGLGAANPTSVSVEWMKNEFGVDWMSIPYKGAGDGLQGFATGESQILFVGALNVLPFAQSGIGRPLVVPGESRLAQLPDVPTLRELGLSDTGIVSVSYGIFAPAGTPAEVITRLRNAFAEIIRSPDVKERVSNSAMMPVGDTSEEFVGWMAAERKRVAGLIQLLNLPKLD